MQNDKVSLQCTLTYVVKFVENVKSYLLSYLQWLRSGNAICFL